LFRDVSETALNLLSTYLVCGFLSEKRERLRVEEELRRREGARESKGKGKKVDSQKGGDWQKKGDLQKKGDWHTNQHILPCDLVIPGKMKAQSTGLHDFHRGYRGIDHLKYTNSHDSARNPPAIGTMLNPAMHHRSQDMRHKFTRTSAFLSHRMSYLNGVREQSKRGKMGGNFGEGHPKSAAFGRRAEGKGKGKVGQIRNL